MLRGSVVVYTIISKSQSKCARLCSSAVNACCRKTKRSTKFAQLSQSQTWQPQAALLSHETFSSITQERYLTKASHYEKWTDLSYEDLVALLESNDIQLFDVREPKEIATTGTIDGSINIPLGEVKEALKMREVDFFSRYRVSKPQKHDTNIVFFGLGPIKSSAALELAHKFDYKKARHYSGGFEEWSKQNKTWAKN